LDLGFVKPKPEITVVEKDSNGDGADTAASRTARRGPPGPDRSR